MKVSHIRIRNILGISEYAFEPGKGFTEIRGPNGSCKTTLIEACKSLAVGGHDATLLSAGATEGELVWVLDDGHEIKKTVTPGKTDLEVRKNGKVQRSPATIVKALVNQFSNNPIDLLSAKPAERVKVLLESMPIDIDTDRLSEIAGFNVKEVPGLHGLHVIDDTYKQIFDHRTGTNRAVDEKKKTIRQMRDLIPEQVGEIDGGEEELDAQLQAIDSAKDAEIERIDTKLAAVRADSAQKVDDIKADAERRIEELQKQIDDIKAQRDADVEAERVALQNLEQRASAQRQRTLEKHATDRTPYSEQLTAIRANRDAAAKRDHALQTIEQLEAELQVLEAEAQRETDALEQIKAYKLELLETLPVPGIEIKDGQIYRDGVPFDRLNTQQKVDIAVDIAKLRAGPLGLICVDGIELMDTANYEAFRQKCLSHPELQFITARVSDGDFEVRTYE